MTEFFHWINWHYSCSGLLPDICIFCRQLINSRGVDMKREIRNSLLLTLLLVFLLVPAIVLNPAFVHARQCSITQTTVCNTVADCPAGESCDAVMNSYCITPPFITAGLKPNLLLMIDNSASMYDLQYQDSSNLYCANAPTTTCSPLNSACAGASSCASSVASSSVTSFTRKACTADAQCPLTPVAYTGKACVSDANCAAPGSKCNAGVCSKCNTTTGVGDCSVSPKCSAGFCRNCNTATGVGDCSSSTVTEYAPIACTADSHCTAGGGTCPVGKTCTWAASDICNNKCSVTRQCYDTTYDDGRSYYGYFDAAETYSFDFTNDKFTSGAAWPAGCTYTAGTPGYFCVNTTGSVATAAEEIVADATGFVAKGNFLNWLTTSKFDVEKQYLTGGKFDPTSSTLIAESRGCAGRKFIKSVPGVNLTFAIRGGTPGGISATQSQATEYGQTYIEISTGVYNASDCLAAMNNWMTLTTSPVNLGDFQNDTKGCVGAGNSTYNATNMWNHILHDCYNGILGKAGGYSTNLGPLEGECTSAYASIENSIIASGGIPIPIGTPPQSTITDPNSGIAICSSALSYTDAGGTPQTGYLGKCYLGGGAFDNTCAVTQMTNYCTLSINTTPVTDPSSTDLQGSGASAPGFILEQGLMNTQPIYTFRVQVAMATAPTGLIDKYGDRIRFGAMTFQNDSSGSECGVAGSFSCAKACWSAGTGYTTRVCYLNSDCPTGSGQTCQALPKTDGGSLVSYIGVGHCSLTIATPCTVNSDCPNPQYCVPEVGSHSTGLIKSIDDIPATSWTSFAETYYNAMGYFARANDYSLSPPTSRSDAKFNALRAPNTAINYTTAKNPSQYRCQSNNILLITDGMSTADRSVDSEALATLYADQVPYITKTGTTFNPGDAGYDPAKNHGYGTCPPYSGSRSISNLAWVAKNRNIKSLSTATPASTAITGAPSSASETITTYVVYSGPQTSSLADLCDPKTLMNNTAKNGGTDLYVASDPSILYTQLDAAMSNVAAKAASGTAASILSNSEGSGANILQAVFYPKKIFENSTFANWIGEMQNLWYFVDPLVRNSTIREDTDSDLTLNLVNDYVVRFGFEDSADKTMVQRYNDADGDGIVIASDKVGALIDPDYVKSIWRAGAKLWARNDASDPRTIYTAAGSTSGNTPRLFVVDGAFDAAAGVWNALQIPSTLQIPTITNAERQALAGKLINYVRGTDQADDTAPCLNADCKYRNRTVTMGVCSGDNQKRCTTASVAADCPSGNSCVFLGFCSNSAQTGCTTAANCPAGVGVTCRKGREWKLGDIISSTPRVQSTVRLNTYNLPPPGGYTDQTYQSYIGSNDYARRGMVYVGANDGMLHAFKLGTLSVQASSFKKAELTGTNLGSESWAFIPSHSLPFLKYTSDKGYGHLYFVDGRTVIFDASIGYTGTVPCIKSTYDQCDKPVNGSIPMVTAAKDLDPTKNVWRTVVIAGMGLGGATRDATDTCTEGAAGSCIKTPISGVGYSSYFALDITNPEVPKYMWEFSNSLLGLSTSAPAIVRVGPKDKNGRWFAVFGNGPFGPIDHGTQQFKAESDQKLSFFVVDLNASPPFVLNTNYWIKDTLADGSQINSAFAGTLLGGSIDADRRESTKTGNYQDDAVYAGYVKLGSAGKWTDGGVVRIMTMEDQNPANWKVSKVIDGIGPVTTAIARTQDTRPGTDRNLWLYFGTGRYYYRDAVTLDDNDTQRFLFGIKEPCYNTATVPGNVLDKNCSAAIPVTTAAGLPSINSDNGWQISLDPATAGKVCSVDFTTTCTADSDCPMGQSCGKYGAERVVTDTVALTNGTVFFTTFKPTLDICGYGGNSFLWGVKYNTGGQAAANALVGKALIQLSTGEFKEIDLSTAFTDKGGRRMAQPMTGKPPSDAPPIVSSSQNKPLKKILHIQEH